MLSDRRDKTWKYVYLEALRQGMTTESFISSTRSQGLHEVGDPLQRPKLVSPFKPTQGLSGAPAYPHRTHKGCRMEKRGKVFRGGLEVLRGQYRH